MSVPGAAGAGAGDHAEAGTATPPSRRGAARPGHAVHVMGASGVALSAASR